MKIKQIKKQSYKLLQLNIIKTNLNKTKNNGNCVNFQMVEHHLKKVAQVIFLYHSKNKQIAYVKEFEQSDTQLDKILKKTKHILLKENGCRTKKAAILVTKNQEFQIKTSNLIVNMTNSLSANFVKNPNFYQTPKIAFNVKTSFFNNNIDYKIHGYLNFKSSHLQIDFFSSILKSILFKNI